MRSAPNLRFRVVPQRRPVFYHPLVERFEERLPLGDMVLGGGLLAWSLSRPDLSFLDPGLLVSSDSHVETLRTGREHAYAFVRPGSGSAFAFSVATHSSPQSRIETSAGAAPTLVNADTGRLSPGFAENPSPFEDLLQLPRGLLDDLLAEDPDGGWPGRAPSTKTAVGGRAGGAEAEHRLAGVEPGNLPSAVALGSPDETAPLSPGARSPGAVRPLLWDEEPAAVGRLLNSAGPDSGGGCSGGSSMAVNDGYSVAQGQTLNMPAPGVLSNDAFCNPATTQLVNAHQPPQSGSLTFRNDGSFTFVANANYVGTVNFTYQFIDTNGPSNIATVTINVTGIPPLAVDDEFAVGMDETLDEPAPGVLYNDVSYGGPLTAVLENPTTNGFVNLRSDGSFTYTPNTGFSGIDLFTYRASDAGLLSAQPATVRIFVVQIDLQMAGVGAGQKLNPGGFVPINANNDNGSAVVNEIPASRDFSVNPLPGGALDPDLVQVDVNIVPAVPLPGFFILAVNNTGTGRIRLWDNRNKGAEVTAGVYTFATLPRRFFVEGTEPSAALRESNIPLSYFFVDPLRGVVGAGSDRVNVTVTPVITAFTVTPGAAGAAGVVFVNGMDGRMGMQAATAAGAAGAAFSATLTRTGLAGNATYIHNWINVDNGVGGAAAGWVFTAASGRPNLNTLARVGTAFPFLDRLAAPPPPDYDVNFAVVNPDANTQRVTANDSPSTGFPAGSQDLQNIDVRYRFTLFLVWRWGAAGAGIIYTLASIDWNVVFRADTHVAGRGVTVINAASGVTAVAFAVTHANPTRLVAPIGNGNVVIR